MILTRYLPKMTIVSVTLLGKVCMCAYVVLSIIPVGFPLLFLVQHASSISPSVNPWKPCSDSPHLPRVMWHCAIRVGLLAWKNTHEEKWPLCLCAEHGTCVCCLDFYLLLNNRERGSSWPRDKLLGTQVTLVCLLGTLILRKGRNFRSQRLGLQ